MTSTGLRAPLNGVLQDAMAVTHRYYAFNKTACLVGFFFQLLFAKNTFFRFNELSRGGKRYEPNKRPETTFNSFNFKKKNKTSFLKVLMLIPEKRWICCSIKDCVCGTERRVRIRAH